MEHFSVFIAGLDEPEYARVAAVFERTFPNLDLRRVKTKQIKDELGVLPSACIWIIKAPGSDGEADALLAILRLQNFSGPIILLVDAYREASAVALLNHGADRVLSMQELESTLPACIEYYSAGCVDLPSAEIRESSGVYRLPDPIIDLQRRLHQAIGSSNFLESILNTFTAIVVVFDQSGRIIFFNRMAEEKTGYSQKEVLDRPFQDLFLLPEEREKVLQVLARLREGKYPSQNRNAWLTREGEILQIDWSNTVLEGPDHETQYVIGMGLDVTETVQKSESLKKSEERFARIFKSNPLGMALVSYPDGKLLELNDSLLRLLEINADQVTGKHVSELGLFPPEDLESAQYLSDLRRLPVVNLERKILTRSRRLLYLVISLEIIEFTGDPCILVMVQDMSERIAAEQRMKRFNEELERSVLARTAALQAVNRELQAEVSFRKAIESSSGRLIQIIWETPDIVTICSLGGQVQYLNKTGRRMFGINEIDSVSHLSIYSAYSEDFKKYIVETMRPYVEEHGVWHGETELILPDGRVIPVSQVVIGHRDDEGKVLFFSSIARDISDQRKASEDLRLAYEKEKELGLLRSNFLSMTSHQFRTPLSTILSSAELIEHYGEQWAPEKRKTHARRIQDAAQRLNQMLDDILDYSRLEAQESRVTIEEVDLVALSEGMIRLMKETDRYDHPFIFEHEDGDCRVHSDRMILETVVENLLSNALKYSPGGKAIRVEIKRDEGDVILSVQDEGIGISEADLAMVFEPFFRGSNVEDEPGSGLGLMTVKKSLDLIQGTISVQSKIGQGTLVTVWIPDLSELPK